MCSTDLPNEEIVNLSKTSDNAAEKIEGSESSNSGSEISLSEQIVLQSNEKRLREKMTSLQTSITNLKKQLKLEKTMWKEDMEKIRILQQQQEARCVCVCQNHKSNEDNLSSIIMSRCNSNFTLSTVENNIRKSCNDLLKTHSIKQLLELQLYKRKLTETENMCNMELLKVKQSLEDLKNLQNIATVWGRSELEDKVEKDSWRAIENEQVREIFVNDKKTNE